MRLRLALVCELACLALAQPVKVDILPSPPITIAEPRIRSTEIRNASTVDLIRIAWKVDADDVIGGPDWIGVAHM